MLTSLASTWRTARAVPKSSSGLKTAKNVAKSKFRARSLPLTTVSRRSYAMMYYTDPYVAPAYDKEPTVTINAILRDSVGTRGKKYCQELRREHKLIPAVINRGNIGKPLLLEIDPRVIFFLMKGPGTRFLGRRYILDVEGLAKYEVIPQQMDVEALGYYPLAVTFAVWNPKIVPKPTLPPHVHRKFFESLQEYPSLEEQKKMREDGTYVYKRFMANSIQKETAKL